MVNLQANLNYKGSKFLDDPKIGDVVVVDGIAYLFNGEEWDRHVTAYIPSYIRPLDDLVSVFTPDVYGRAAWDLLPDSDKKNYLQGALVALKEISSEFTVPLE